MDKVAPGFGARGTIAGRHAERDGRPGHRAAEIAVVIPALNEAETVGRVVRAIPRFRPLVIIVADNGSTDGTATAAREAGARVVTEPRRGYGAACLKALAAVPDRVEVVAFLDADLSDDPAWLPALVEPILAGEQDLVIGTRTQGTAEKGALTPAQILGAWLACRLLRLFFGQRCTDLGPFRAVRRTCLDAMHMRDRDFGWTVEMQIRAARMGLRVAEVPVPYRCRRTGRSKISGTVLGSLKAGGKIIGTIFRYGLGGGTMAAMTPSTPLPAGPDAEEARLLEGLKRGDGQAFERLVRGHGGRMLVVARRLLGNEEDARDAVQDAFLSAFKAVGGFKGDARLSTWLHRIVVNAALMKLRTRRRKPESPIEDLLPGFPDDDHHAEPGPAGEETAEEKLSRQETRELVRAKIDQLPDSYRTVLVLRDIEELSTEETAALLDESTNVVKVRLHRARQALRTLLAPRFRRSLA